MATAPEETLNGTSRCWLGHCRASPPECTPDTPSMKWFQLLPWEGGAGVVLPQRANKTGNRIDKKYFIEIPVVFNVP